MVRDPPPQGPREVPNLPPATRESKLQGLGSQLPIPQRQLGGGGAAEKRRRKSPSKERGDVGRRHRRQEEEGRGAGMEGSVREDEERHER